MNSLSARGKLLSLLALAAALRFYGLNWDGGLGAHPDERYIVALAEGLRFSPPSALNPFALDPLYPYGHLPLYLLLALRTLLPATDPLLLGRALAALSDLATVALAFLLGREVFGETAGLWAAAFLAVMPLHVQQAHFFTADPLLAAGVVGALYYAVRLARRGRPADGLLAGSLFGLALSAKFTGAFLLFPLGMALTFHAGGRRWRLGTLALAAAGGVFAVANPYALVEWGSFWHAVSRQAAILRGTLDAPYTLQFHDTLPYLYPIAQQLRWGMTVPLGLLAFGGLGYALWRAVREPPSPAEWVLLAWALPFFAFFGGLPARFPRYLLPLTPLLALYAASLPGKVAAYLRPVALLTALLVSVALVATYHLPHPWMAAAEWLDGHLSPADVVAVEHWDQPLVPPATGATVRVLPVFDADTPEKQAVMERVLAEADYIVIASRRGYGVLAGWPERYPWTARYYRRLFSGDLGFVPVACFRRDPRLGPLVIKDDPAARVNLTLPDLCRAAATWRFSPGRLDESFVVYDHPQVIIFARR